MPPLPELLKMLRLAFEGANIPQLKEVGAELAEQAFIANEPRIIDFSTVAYALAKLLEKHYILTTPEWQAFEARVKEALSRCEALVVENRLGEAFELAKALAGEIDALGAKLGRFVMGIVEKARIKAAAQAYAHGASLSRAAQLASIDRRALSHYVAHTLLHEKYATLSVEERLRRLRKALAASSS